MTECWTCVTVDAATEVIEELAGEVASLLNRGVELTNTGFRFYLEAAPSPQAWQPLLEQAIRAVQARSVTPFPEPVVHASSLPGEDWASGWKKHFKPLRVGRRFLVCPTWEEPAPSNDDIVLRIDPGRAFGTGHHETTRLCLEWLERWREEHNPSGSKTLLDVGTGSGILAMAGALLGFQSAIGVDNDPEAIEVAGRNVEVNALRGTVRLAVGTARDITDRFDVVMANIQAGPLISLAAELIARLKCPAWLVLSGILVDQKDQVQQAYESRGVRLHQSVTDGEWCLLAFTQPPEEKGTAHESSQC